MTRRTDDAASTTPPARSPSIVPVALPLVTLHADGIVQVDYSPCDRITLEVVRHGNARHRELSPGIKTPVLLTGGRVGNVEYKAQRHASSPEVCTTSGRRCDPVVPGTASGQDVSHVPPPALPDACVQCRARGARLVARVPAAAQVTGVWAE